MNKETADFILSIVKCFFMFIIGAYILLSICDRLFRTNLDRLIVDIYDYSKYKKEVYVIIRDVYLQEGKISLKEIIISIPRKTFEQMHMEAKSKAEIQFTQGLLTVGGKFICPA